MYSIFHFTLFSHSRWRWDEMSWMRAFDSFTCKIHCPHFGIIYCSRNQPNSIFLRSHFWFNFCSCHARIAFVTFISAWFLTICWILADQVTVLFSSNTTKRQARNRFSNTEIRMLHWLVHLLLYVIAPNVWAQLLESREKRMKFRANDFKLSSIYICMYRVIRCFRCKSWFFCFIFHALVVFVVFLN